jgi:hypothetical protein
VGGVSLLDAFSAQLVMPPLEVPSNREVQLDVSYGVQDMSVEAALHAQYAIKDARHM